MQSIWNKYQKIKKIEKNENIKTYLGRIEPIIKEIKPKNEDNYHKIIEYFTKFKDEYKIYEIIEEKGKIYIVIEKNIEKNKKIDEIIISGKFIEKEPILEGNGKKTKTNEPKNEIYCIYNIGKQTEINILHDYNENLEKWSESTKKLYLEAKEINKKIFDENIELYVNKIKIKFDYKIKLNDSNKEIRVKFKFKTKLTNTSYMFRNCSSLISIDLSSFNTSNVTNMNCMFNNCDLLKSIDLSSFNTSNVTKMYNMFSNCSSLQSINLSSFNTTNVENMSYMFYECSSLQSIDLS